MGFVKAPRLHLSALDLSSDPAARRYQKEERVAVCFAVQAGAVESREGANHYQAGDAIVTGSTQDQWSVTRARFEEKYAPFGGHAMGEDGVYAANPVPVWARRVDVDFAVERRAGGDLLTGVAGDWVLQYGPNDFGLVEAARFAKVYRLID